MLPNAIHDYKVKNHLNWEEVLLVNAIVAQSRQTRIVLFLQNASESKVVSQWKWKAVEWMADVSPKLMS